MPRSLLWATDVDVLPLDRVVVRREGYFAIRSPSNPAHFWGNLLLFDDPPLAGDGPRWERLFDVEFGSEPLVAHRAFGWDRIDGAQGLAREEFVDRGFDLDDIVGLVAQPGGIRPSPGENRDVTVRPLEPAGSVDQELWEQVVELQVAARGDRFDEAPYRAFSRRRLDDLRALFRLGRGAWYVALDAGGREGEALASCGVVVTDGRARFQAVDTAAAYRRRGICSRLIAEAVRRSAAQHGAEQFVIAADPSYHALRLYESLGFERMERVCGVWRRPRDRGHSQVQPPGD